MEYDQLESDKNGIRPNQNRTKWNQTKMEYDQIRIRQKRNQTKVEQN